MQTVVPGANDFAWQALVRMADREEAREARNNAPPAQLPRARVKVVVPVSNNNNDNNNNFVPCAAPLVDDDYLRSEIEAHKQKLERVKGKLIAARLLLDKANQDHEVHINTLRETYTKLSIEHRTVIAERDDLREKLDRERIQRDKYWRFRVSQEEARTMDALEAIEEVKRKAAKISE